MPREPSKTVQPTHRVVVETHPRGVIVRLVDAGKQVILEDERFLLPDSDADLPPHEVARDVFNLLYQCANGSINGDEK
jgi:hypothetical protein